MVRRAERGVGLAIRKGQVEGTIETETEARVRAGVIRQQSVENILVKTRPTDIASQDDLRGNGAGILHLTDGVTDEQFDSALTEAKDEGNLSRANVVRKIGADLARLHDILPEVVAEAPFSPLARLRAEARRTG